jgi:hypothetical protein
MSHRQDSSGGMVRAVSAQNSHSGAARTVMPPNRGRHQIGRDD